MQLMKIIDNSPIGRKLLAALLLVIALIAANGFVGLWSTAKLNESATETYTIWLTAMRQLSDVRDALTEQRRAINAHMLVDEPAEKQVRADRLATLHESIEKSWQI